MTTPVTPRDVVLAWVDAFDQADPAALAALYAADAVNHQGLIRFQRGYSDKLAFLRLPLPTR